MQKIHNIVSKCMATGLILGLIGGGLSTARADDMHPHYLRALSDLRYARAWVTALGENNVMGREMDVVVHIARRL